MGPSLEVAQGADSSVVFGVSILRGGIGPPYRVRSLVDGGIDCAGTSMLNILAICFKSSVSLSTSVVSGIVGVGLRMVCVRSNTAFINKYSYYIIGKGRLAGKNYMVSETLDLAILGVYYIIQQ